MHILIVIILGVSFVLYTLFGGADFGAGIVEMFAGKKEEFIISKAIAPVWEANHVWLILAIVILFTGFPGVYASLSLVLHIPLMMVLLGIIMRGCAFTFRSYDVGENKKSRRLYTIFFRVSSFVTPVFLGMLLGAMMLGRITLNPSAGFYETFVAPWLNLFCFTMGLYAASLFAYLASLFLVGETKTEKERIRYARFSKQAMIATIVLGLLVFVVAEADGLHLAGMFFDSPLSMLMMGIASLLCFVIWYLLGKERTKIMDLKTGVCIQVTAILGGWFRIQFPVLVAVKNGYPLTIYNAVAPQATLQQLVFACMAGLLLVIPGFVYLFRIFKTQKKSGDSIG